MLKRTTVYLDPKLHQRVKIKSVQTGASISDLVSEGLRSVLADDKEALHNLKATVSEPAAPYTVAGKRGQEKTVIQISAEELETLEVLADKKLLKSIVKAEKDLKAGRLYSHKDVFGV